MAQALYRKWRPARWDEVLGQEHIIRTLRNAVRSGRTAHAYLFSGPRGTGKTTTARLLAKAVNCLHADPDARPCDACAHCQAVNEGRFLDLIEIDAASNNGVEDVRELRDRINFSPSQGKYKIYIIDEVHMLSTPAFNALLKTLEEPPSYAIFVLATTEIHKIPATVLSRCQRHEFRRLPLDVIVSRLEYICQQEGIQAAPEALSLIARHSAGGMRDAISLLDQMASTGEAVTLDVVRAVLGTSSEAAVREVIEALLRQAPGQGLTALQQALDGGSDPRALAREIVAYLRHILLLKMGAEAPADLTGETLAAMRAYARDFDRGFLLHAIRAFNEAASAGGTAWMPSLGLELALADSLTLPQAVDLPPQREAAPVPRRSAPAAEQENASRRPQPAERPAPAASLATAAAEKEPIDLSTVQKVWPQVKNAIRRVDGSLNGLLNSAHLVEVRDGTLVLGFASEVLREKAARPEKVQTTERYLQEALGRLLRIACVVGRSSQEATADDMVAAALRYGGRKVS